MYNFAAALAGARLADGDAHRTALRFDGAAITYAELLFDVERVGGALLALGVARAGRVALVLPDVPAFMAVFLGAVRIGAVPVTLSTNLAERELAYALGHSGASVAIVHPLTVERVLAVRGATPALRQIIVDGDPVPDGTLSLARLIADAARTEPASTDEDDMCFWQYSSGTTGAPKAVVHRQRGAAAPAELHGRHVVGIGRDDRVLSVAKLSSSYGLNSSLTIPLSAGAATILQPRRSEPVAICELIRHERPTLLYAVPTFYASLLRAVDAGDATLDASSIRCCVSAGEALPAPVLERWRRRFGLEILDGIGSTEIGYIAISNSPGAVRPGSSGRVVPGYEAKVVDDAGHELPSGQAGELWVRGPSQASYYWNDPERTSRTFRDGWVATGDRALVDGDGWFVFQGRADDMLKVSGQWVSPLEVEAVLLQHPAIADCAVIGREDGDGLTKPCAYVVLREPAGAAEALASELQSSVRASLAAYKFPRWVEFVPELPRTPTGKIQRFRLRG